uniref:Uncharacterized protein n=1 Tax=uncultured marine virus TaxID=186617 RepID=A0A0F7L9P3_9VIRU|nr:hypothetical protein [uncultured marine virus]
MLIFVVFEFQLMLAFQLLLLAIEPAVVFAVISFAVQLLAFAVYAVLAID